MTARQAGVAAAPGSAAAAEAMLIVKRRGEWLIQSRTLAVFED